MLSKRLRAIVGLVQDAEYETNYEDKLSMVNSAISILKGYRNKLRIEMQEMEVLDEI